jgi:hypothetical protein
MSDQQPPVLEAQLVEGGGTASAVDPVAASGAGTPEDHFNHDFMTREMQLTLGKIDPNVETLLSTVNSLVSQVAAIQTHLNNIDNAINGLGGLVRLPSGVSLGNAVQQIMQKVG